MQAAVPVGEGAMAALLGADIEKAEALVKAVSGGAAPEGLDGQSGDLICTIANDNDPTQVVISGHRAAIEHAITLVKDFEIKRGMLLPVSAPFHCPLMQPAADAMAAALAAATLTAPLVPVYANVLAAPIADPDEIRRRLVEQITGRVRWRESVLAMWDADVTDFVELGGKVLGPLVKRIVPDANITSVVTMDDIEAVLGKL
jgi:[acyl-carrier-protein] S-malonyltransferase